MLFFFLLLLLKYNYYDNKIYNVKKPNNSDVYDNINLFFILENSYHS